MELSAAQIRLWIRIVRIIVQNNAQSEEEVMSKIIKMLTVEGRNAS